MKNQVTIEKKITFTVYGMEFDNLKTAQFFARYVDNRRKICDDQNKPELTVRIILDELYRLVSADVVNTDEELIEIVMGLQMPKPARKKKEIQNCMKVDECLPGPVVLDDDGETKFENVLDLEAADNELQHWLENSSDPLN